MLFLNSRYAFIAVPQNSLPYIFMNSRIHVDLDLLSIILNPPLSAHIRCVVTGNDLITDGESDERYSVQYTVNCI